MPACQHNETVVLAGKCNMHILQQRHCRPFDAYNSVISRNDYKRTDQLKVQECAALPMEDRLKSQKHEKKYG